MVEGTLAETPSSEPTQIDAYREAIKGGRADAYWYVSLVGLRPQNPIRIVKRVAKGLAFLSFVRLQRNTGWSMGDLAEAVAIKPRTLHRRKKEGRLDPEESDRLLRVSRIFGRALELFEGDVEAARRWLATPQGALGGERPMVLAKTDLGAREVEALVERLEHGVLT
jgi:putative toxin-antitoxin system antitoxin component (TIGR02293 family)